VADALGVTSIHELEKMSTQSKILPKESTSKVQPDGKDTLSICPPLTNTQRLQLSPRTKGAKNSENVPSTVAQGSILVIFFQGICVVFEGATC
jgi:hypothetical protein